MAAGEPAATDRGDDDSTVLGSHVSGDDRGWWVELTVGFRDELVRRIPPPTGG